MTAKKIKPFVFSWNRHSKSAKMLAKALGADFAHPESGTAPANGQPVINWGSSYTPPWAWQQGVYINKPLSVGLAVDKLKTFRILEKANLPVPEYTTDVATGRRWINEGGVVYARKKLTGNKGDGCVTYHQDHKLVHLTLRDLEEVKVFTKGFNADFGEFKVHVINGKVDHVISIQKDTDFIQDPYIRNHKNGWTFYDEGREFHPEIKRVCVAAIKALGLDFGVVDIGIGKKPGVMCIYEVNTAPGGEQEDMNMYARAFKKEYGISAVK